MSAVLAQANIVGVGEGAHFVSEFSAIRFDLIRHMLDHHDFNVIGMECSAIQADRLNEWFTAPQSDPSLSGYASPLTEALYGSVLTRVKEYLGDRRKRIRLVGVDLPNTMSPADEHALLSAEAETLDPHIAVMLTELGALIGGIGGESAVTSSMAWGELSEADRDRAFTIATRLRLRFEAIAPLLRDRFSPDDLDRFHQSLLALQYTLEAMFAMSALFNGSAIEAETSARDHFMSASVERYLNRNPDAKMILLAHNNHIQKEPVVFSGELSGIPMGMHLRALPGYRSVALTHLGDTVPEMCFPDAESRVGFSVIESVASPIDVGSAEWLCRGGQTLQGSDTVAAGSPASSSIRSQSAVADVDVGKAFDLIVFSPSASKDATVEF